MFYKVQDVRLSEFRVLEFMVCSDLEMNYRVSGSAAGGFGFKGLDLPRGSYPTTFLGYLVL